MIATVVVYGLVAVLGYVLGTLARRAFAWLAHTAWIRVFLDPKVSEGRRLYWWFALFLATHPVGVARALRRKAPEDVVRVDPAYLAHPRPSRVQVGPVVDEIRVLTPQERAERVRRVQARRKEQS